jgi:hypothetical protein
LAALKCPGLANWAVRSGEKEKTEWRSEQESRDLYEQALSEAARIANFGVSRGLRKVGRGCFLAFAGFLESMGQGLEVESAIDLDVIAFI